MGQPSYPIFGKTLLSFVSEPGLYKLIMRSDKPIARTFQDWVTRDVLTEKRVGTVTSLGVHEFLRGVSPSAGLHAKTPLSVVSESGLYKLIIRAHPERNAAVRAFQDWVTRDVLPAIRKDGAYVMGEEKVATGEMRRSGRLRPRRRSLWGWRPAGPCGNVMSPAWVSLGTGQQGATP